MNAQATAVQITEQEYLALETASTDKHEFVNGEMWAMSGGTPAHAAIAANLSRALGNRLLGRPCAVMSSDLRVHVDETGLYTYPDLTVVCERPQYSPHSSVTLTNPTVLVEVLSDSTEAYDRGAKFAHYRRIPSLKAYVLVAQSPRRVEVFHRAPEGAWIYTAAEEGEIALTCLEISLNLEEVYHQVDWLLAPPPATES